MEFFRRIGRFSRNESGLAAMEFALCFPILVASYFGVLYTYEITKTASSISNASATVADLTSRIIDIDDQRAFVFFATAENLAGGLSKYETFNVSIVSVINPPDPLDEQDYEVSWSKSSTNIPDVTFADFESESLPTIADGESIIVVVIDGTYKPTFASLNLPASQSVHRVSVRRPRFVSQVTLLDDA